MADILSHFPVAGRLVRPSQPNLGAITLAPVQVHQIETNPDRRARCLKHLLKANHVNYSLVCNSLASVNHSPHLLSSAYLLGASDVQLYKLYEAATKGLESWTPSPAEIVDLDWTEFLGDKRYQKAYVDFFEDKLAMRFSYDWKQEAEHFLFGGEKPLIHGLICGLGHALIHLGYAYEMDCKEVGVEALGLACVEHDLLYKYLEESSYTKPSPTASSSPLDLLTTMSADERFNKLPEDVNPGQLERLFETHEHLIMEYWNAWELHDPPRQFQQSQEAAVSLALANVGPGKRAHDQLFVHLLTASHAVRILLPFFPPRHHVTLVREWWLLAIVVFILNGRSRPEPANLERELDVKDWKYVEKQVLTSKWCKDAHYIKAICAMREASRTWGDAQRQYLGAAVSFVEGFKEWKA